MLIEEETIGIWNLNEKEKHSKWDKYEADRLLLRMGVPLHCQTRQPRRKGIGGDKYECSLHKTNSPSELYVRET